MIFSSRLKRIIKKIRNFHREKGSFSLTLAYLFKILSKKSLLLARHLYGSRHIFLLPYRNDKKRRRIAAHREGKPVLAMLVTGGVGDLLVMARFVRDLQKETGDFLFDVFCAHPEIAQWIFASVPGYENTEFDTALRLGRFHAFYDAQLDLSQGVQITRQDRKSSVLKQGNFHKIFQNINHSAQNLHLYINNQPFLDNGLGRVAVYSNASRRDFLHHMAGISYGGDQFPVSCSAGVLDRIPALQGQSWITVHNGFDANFVVEGERATKCYPHFDAVLASIKRARPDILIVQVGTSSSTRLSNADLDLISQTTLQEAAALLQGSMLHLDNESGLVHLSACLGTPSVVIFGPTPSDYFGYPSNTNIDPTFCGGCWWINELWMDRCPRQFASAECLDTIDPEHVARAFLQTLDAISTEREN